MSLLGSYANALMRIGRGMTIGQMSPGMMAAASPLRRDHRSTVLASTCTVSGLDGDGLADIAVLRRSRAWLGRWLGPMISRLVAQLAADAPRALKTIRAATSRPARMAGWSQWTWMRRS